MDEALPRRRPPSALGDAEDPGAERLGRVTEVPDIAGPVQSIEEAVQVTEMRFIYAWAQHMRAAGRAARARAQGRFHQRAAGGGTDGPAASGATPHETDKPRS